jgi:hypothetical protein
MAAPIFAEFVIAENDKEVKMGAQYRKHSIRRLDASCSAVRFSQILVLIFSMTISSPCYHFLALFSQCWNDFDHSDLLDMLQLSSFINSTGTGCE